jgi:hypothetical protein
MAGVDEAEDMREMVDMTEMAVGVRKKGAHYGNAGHIMLNMDWLKEAAK